MSEERLKKEYYKANGHWKGSVAVEKLHKATGIDKDDVLEWLKKQPVWQIYQPAPKKIVRIKIREYRVNHVHQCDLLYLPHDKVGRKTYKFAVCVVDVASRFKKVFAIEAKTAGNVCMALNCIYSTDDLRWPSVLQVDMGKEFMGCVTSECAKHDTAIVRIEPDKHRRQGIVERFNRTLAERLFSGQFAEELETGGRSKKWVKELNAVVDEINNEVTRITPAEAIKMGPKRLEKTVNGLTSGEIKAASAEERDISGKDLLRYLYRPGEYEKGARRATDPIWSLTQHCM